METRLYLALPDQEGGGGAIRYGMGPCPLIRKVVEIVQGHEIVHYIAGPLVPPPSGCRISATGRGGGTFRRPALTLLVLVAAEAPFPPSPDMCPSPPPIRGAVLATVYATAESRIPGMARG